MENKYIKLLLERCLKLKKGQPLFISYNKIVKSFIEKMLDYAKKMGVTDIYLDERDSYKIHDLLINTKKEDIEKLKEFDSAIWDVYAQKDAAFLMIESEIPHLMDDVDSEKLGIAMNKRRVTKSLYKEKQLACKLAWCIACYPNEFWAKEIYGTDNAYELFMKDFTNICMLNEEEPIKAWDNFLNKQHKMVEKLNNLKIKKLHYKNNLGTDLTLELPENALWQSASSGEYIVNLPSYEVFTTPHYKKTNGIVYSSKSLTYSGCLINHFYLCFKNGKVIDFDAKEGKDVLKEIINSDELSSFLGEAALVNYDSPISNTQKVFQSTLIDENAACHLALGNGFAECIKDGISLKDKELLKLGVNTSKNHVDFMIGTKDLEVIAETPNGDVTIMRDGNIVI